ncbi:MAG: hypothetical protein C4309_05075 [Chloroflexota bacterium]
MVGKGWQRDFLGFCRARNTVIEATIMATRLHLYDPATALQAMQGYAEIVHKTGDATEKEALQRVHEFITRWADAHSG